MSNSNNGTNETSKKVWRVLCVIGRTLASVASTVFKVLGTLLLIILTTGIIFVCIAAVYIKTNIMPEVDMNLSDVTLNLSSTIYYQDNETGEWVELQQLHGEENRIWLDYEEIPIWFEKAAVAIEDKRFYEHQGVDWYRTAGAFVNMFLGMRDNFGGSTITQQLIKNLTKDDEVTVTRKILEIFRALDFEKQYSKEVIMEWYLNTIYLGEGCNGVATASQVYFGKDASELTLAECASIIGITNNPSLYDPYIDKEANKERQETILQEMYEQGMIDYDQYTEAVEQELVFKRGEGNTSSQVEPNSWYVDQIIYDVTEDLMDLYDISEIAARQLLYGSGYKIYACIDMDIQEMVDSVYGSVDNLPYYSASGQQLQSAITIMDPYTGRVVAMAGGMGEKEGSLEWNRATMTVRQPGSSIKPVSVYAPAINLGLITPQTIMEDTPLRYENGVGYPRNSNGTYRGAVTIMQAVTWSYNTIPAKLIDQMTPQVSYDFMVNNLGFTTLVDYREEEDGKVYSDIDIAPLSMGGLTDGVSTLEMTAAYCTFPNGGTYYEPMTYYYILDSEDEMVIDNESSGSTAMKELTAYYMNQLLRSVVTSGTGTGAYIDGMMVAGKTGTTDENNDRWFIGYTPYYVAAVWTGYDTPENINIGTNPAISLWKSVMSLIHEDLEYQEFFYTEPGPQIANNLTDKTMTAEEEAALEEENEENEPDDPEETDEPEDPDEPTTSPSDPENPDEPTTSPSEPENPDEPTTSPSDPDEPNESDGPYIPV